MKKQIIAIVFLFSLLLSLTFAAAQEMQKESITPDSWLYGLKIAYEKISLALTAGLMF